MKNNLFLTSVILISFVLSACSSTAQANSNGNFTRPSATRTGAAGSNGVDTNLALQLALGTFKLDDTQYKIDAAEAARLLPLWKAARALSKTDTTAAEEVAGLLKQIQDTMSVQQMQTIQEMNLSYQDLPALAQKLGIDLGVQGRFGNGNANPSLQATAQAARRNGDSFGQVFGGGPGGNFNPSARETAVAQRSSTRGASFGLNSALLDAIVQFLEAKVG